MRLFITGGTGFIGKHVVALALQRGHELRCLVRDPRTAESLAPGGVTLINGDLLDPDALRRGMEGCDGLLHLANVYSFWEPDRSVYMRVNVTGTRHVMECALAAGVRKIVHVSSAVTFGEPAERPFTEESESRPIHLTAYARSKLAGDQLCWQLHADRGLPLAGIYPGSVVGPGDEKPSGQLLRNLLGRKMPALVYPRTVFTFVHVRDVAQAIVRAAEDERTLGQKYLVGKEHWSLGDLYRAVRELSGVPLPRMVLPDPAVVAGAWFLTGIADLTKRPPALGLSRDMARIMSRGFCFDGGKAERELGITYTPVRAALEEIIAAHRSA